MLPVIFVSFLVIGCAYIAMTLLLLAGWYRNRPFQATDKPFRTKVTVIIPARNEQEHLPQLLNDMLKQEFPRELLEVIVVDDGSTDQTVECVNSFIRENPAYHLILLRAEQGADLPGAKKSAVSLAVSHASGELILATDADTRHGNQWVGSMTRFFEEFKPQMILGPVAYEESGSLFARIQSCEFMGLMAATDCSCNLHRPVMCNGANIAFTRKAFEMVDGYRLNAEIPSGDDMFLMMKIRKQFGSGAVQFNRSAEAIVYTAAAVTFLEFVHQRLRWVSKSRGYRDFTVMLVAVLTYLFNVTIIAGWIIGFFMPSFLILAMMLLVCKMLAEAPHLWKYATFLGKRRDLVLIPLVQVLNLFYVSIIGLLGNFLPYRWKGRTVNPVHKH